MRIEAPGVFHEAEHLGGSADMVAIVSAVLDEETRRKADGRPDTVIPMRPDHGHLLAADPARNAYPGYSYVGRLKGLAEIRGRRTAALKRRARAKPTSAPPAPRGDGLRLARERDQEEHGDEEQARIRKMSEKAITSAWLRTVRHDVSACRWASEPSAA